MLVANLKFCFLGLRYLVYVSIMLFSRYELIKFVKYLCNKKVLVWNAYYFFKSMHWNFLELHGCKCALLLAVNCESCELYECVINEEYMGHVMK